MNDSAHELHKRLVRRVAEKYTDQGFEVAIHPKGSDKPGFLGEYDPDLIARSPAKSVVVEVKIGTRTAYGERLREIAELTAAQPGWEFSLVIAGGKDFDEGLSFQTLPTHSEIRDRLSRATTLSSLGSPDASFLLLWSCLEALVRIIPMRFQESKASGRPLLERRGLPEPLHQELLIYSLVVHGFTNDHLPPNRLIF